MKGLPLNKVVYAVTWAIVLGFVAVPVAALAIGSFRSGNPGTPSEWTFANYLGLFNQRGAGAALRNTVAIAGIATLVAIVLGTVTAWMTTRLEFPGRRIIRLLATAPFFLPPLLTAMAWSVLANPRTGLINRLLSLLLGVDGILNVYSIPGIAWVMGVSYSPYVLVFVSAALANMDSAREEAARVCGAGWLRTTISVTFRSVTPAILGAGILVLVMAFEQFGIPAVLGVPSGIEVLSTAIYKEIAFYPPRFGQGAALAAVMSVVVGFLLLIQARLLKQDAYVTVGGKQSHTKPLEIGRWRWPVALVGWGYVGLAVVLPYIVIALAAVMRHMSVAVWSWDLLTLDHFASVARRGVIWRAARNSLWIAAVSGGAVAMVGTAIAYFTYRTRLRGRRILDYMGTMPIAVPGIAMAVGLLWVYVRLPLPIYGTAVILVLGYSARQLPYGVRVMGANVQGVDRSLEWAARVSGAGAGLSLRSILLPLLKPSVVGVLMIATVAALRELSVPMLLFAPGNEVLSVALYGAWTGGSVGEAAVVGIVLTALIGVMLGVTQLIARQQKPDGRRV